MAQTQDRSIDAAEEQLDYGTSAVYLARDCNRATGPDYEWIEKKHPTSIRR